MPMYKLTKGTLSKLRDAASGVRALQAEGYVLDGECDKDGNVISTSVVLDAVEAQGELVEPVKRAYTRKAKEE